MFSEIIKKIHNSPHQGVLIITGGGSEAVGELLRHGNGSKTLLEAVVPYHQEAICRLLGNPPEQFCSQQTAYQLAKIAYNRGQSLTDHQPLFGLGVTCSLVKEHEREGRKHHAYIVIQTACHATSYDIHFEKRPASREEEESIVAHYIINAIAEICEISDLLPIPSL